MKASKVPLEVVVPPHINNSTYTLSFMHFNYHSRLYPDGQNLNPAFSKLLYEKNFVFWVNVSLLEQVL